MGSDLLDRFVMHLSIGMIESRTDQDRLIAEFLCKLEQIELEHFRTTIDDHLRSNRGIRDLQIRLKRIDFALLRRSRIEIFFRHIRDLIDAGPDSWPVATTRSLRTSRPEQ